MNKDKSKSRLFYGWVIAGAACLLHMLLTTPPVYAGSYLTARLAQLRGWDESVIGSAASVFQGCVGVFSIPIGLLLDKVRPRKMFAAASLLSASAYYAIYRTAMPRSVYLSMYALLGACAAAALLSAVAVVNSWFDQNRAIPTAVVMSSGGIGGMIMPLLAESVSKRSASLCWLVFAFLGLGSMVLSLLLIRDTPAQVGEIPDGRSWTRLHPQKAAEDRADPPHPDLGRHWLSHSVYYELVFLAFAGRFMMAAVTSYGIYYLLQKGFSESIAVRIFSTFSLGSLAGRLSVSQVDRLKSDESRLSMLDFLMAFAAASVFVFSRSPALCCVAVCLLGFCFGFSHAVFPLMSSRLLGERDYSFLYGLSNAIGSVGSALGPAVIFAVGSRSSYSVSYLVVSVMMLLGTVSAFLLIKPPKTIVSNE